MTTLEAILLSLIQGITEFLPISSSAHLILVPYFFGWEPHSIDFEIVTNAGTLTAAMVYLRHDIWQALQSSRQRLLPTAHPDLLWAVALGTVPVLVVGYLFYDWFATTARQPVIIAWASILFGLVLAWVDRTARRERPLSSLSWFDSLVVGLAQAIALIPGTSRSGITMTAGLQLGLTRTEAARFSFLLAIPVGLIAFAKDVFDLWGGQAEHVALWPLGLSFVVSGVTAYLVIGWLLAWLERQSMTIFVIYRVALGFLILALVQWQGGGSVP